MALKDRFDKIISYFDTDDVSEMKYTKYKRELQCKEIPEQLQHRKLLSVVI